MTKKNWLFDQIQQNIIHMMHVTHLLGFVKLN